MLGPESLTCVHHCCSVSWCLLLLGAVWAGAFDALIRLALGLTEFCRCVVLPCNLHCFLTCLMSIHRQVALSGSDVFCHSLGLLVSYASANTLYHSCILVVTAQINICVCAAKTKSAMPKNEPRHSTQILVTGTFCFLHCRYLIVLLS